ncbi:MAG: DMT family transporter [Alphaproteobacteria bacterium]|jgi:drug/metabolite transporter (DMT)-like permease|nr:DMT family transporter [Alphaproteobacteria bacterium]MBT4086662.1 DMT family transporter [Alphaproteobacteria bacterium]MBT4544041.1 DMT family transporter [Alphaproteobacteria bacterium]MBT5919815.1 DMT family transporter [Alphaproteobacteria bacterium]MBT7744702.1 DMT family transporter [Alphaproteobacteria bacterium]
MSDEGQLPPQKAALAIGLVIVMGIMLSSMDAFAKYLTQAQTVIFVLWGRYFFHSVLTLGFLLRNGSLRFLRCNRPGLQFLRTLFLMGATGNMYWAVSHMPLGDATAIMFLSPLIITGLSVPLLKEKVGIRRWVAVVVGFGGILLIAQPGTDSMNAYAIFPLFSAFCVSFYMITTRLLAAHDSVETTTFYTTAPAAILLSLTLPWTWSELTAVEWGLMATMGGVGALGHFVLVLAFSMAPASMLAPFSYIHLVSAVAISYFFFKDVPSSTTLAGAAIVVSSGLYVWYRETFVKTRPS